jgi:hypothetical protein
MRQSATMANGLRQIPAQGPAGTDNIASPAAERLAHGQAMPPRYLADTDTGELAALFLNAMRIGGGR